MPSPSPDVEHFAQALLCLGRAVGIEARLEHDVPRLAGMLRGEEALRTFFGNPAIRAEGKSRALEELLAGQAHPALIRFLQVLVDQQALPLWPDVAAHFLRLLAESRQMADGQIVSAAPVAEDTVRAIEAEVGRILGRKVQLRVTLSADLLGGLLVRVGDFVIDGTLDSGLAAMRGELMKAG